MGSSYSNPSGSAGGAYGTYVGGVAGPKGAELGGKYGDQLGKKVGLGGNIGLGMDNTFGAGYDKPEMGNVQQGTSVEDVKKAQQGVGNSLQSQQALLAALQGQNGIGQQTAALQGLQGTAGQYQNIASGEGPNPARAMLNQATGQNVANQAALMAGQRGAGANVGLMARQAAQQGANTQQQAVGQGATMQANQQLGALQGMAGVQNNIAGLANNMAANQIGGVNANTQANLANQQQMQNALAGVNTANVASQGNVNTGNAALLQTGMQGKQGLFGGLMNGVGSAIGMAGGGEVHQYADGGDAAPQINGAQSSFGQFLQSNSQPQAPIQDDSDKLLNKGEKKDSTGDLLKTVGTVAAFLNKGGLAADGGHVAAKKPSQKAVKSGNSYSNDKVPAMLSEGEIVIPRDVAMSKDPIKDSAAFVAKVLAKRRSK